VNPSRVHLHKCKDTQKSVVKNVKGDFIVDKCVNFNPFPQSKTSVKEEFLVFNVNDFFDGAIGFEFLQKINGVIDCKKMELILSDISIKLKRKFPDAVRTYLEPTEQKFLNVRVSNDGDFLISQDVYLTLSICINKGIYSSQNKNAYVSISNTSSFKNSIITSKNNNILENVEINNFEIASVQLETENDDREIFSRINIQNLNDEERKKLYQVIIKQRHCFHEEFDKLTCTTAVMHSINTKDDIPVYQKSYKYPYV